MHNRSIRQNKFNLPSMKSLWKELGGYDALVEYNECAVSHLIKSWQIALEKGVSSRDFIKAKSSEVDINLGDMTIDKYRQEMYQWYLIHPYGCIDKFVPLFKEDLKAFGFDINLDFKDKNELEKLVRGLKQAGITITVEDYKFNLDKYYRRCRNLLAHKLDDKERAKIHKLYTEIDIIEVRKFYPTLKNALSDSLKLTFDDYTLCTANLKNISDTLTTNIYGAVDWSKYNILKDMPQIKKIKKYGDDAKANQRIQNAIRSKYGVTLPYETIDKIRNNMAHSNNG